MKNRYSLFIALPLLIIAAIGYAKPLRGKGAYALFVQTAPSAEVSMVKNKKETLQLTLHGVNRKVIYFTDRPVRNSGTLPLRSFINFWASNKADSFKMDPPNVAIETSFVDAKSHKRQHVTLIGALSHPVYNDKTHSLTYTVELEEPQTLGKSLGYTTLFFDKIYFNPGGF